MPRKNEQTNYSPSTNDKMLDFIKEDDELGKSPSFAIQMFLDKMADIQSTGFALGLSMGEIMVLINHCCGYKTWRQIEWKDFDKIQQFVKNNAVNYLKIVDPDFAIKFENYNPMDDQFLLKLEEWCPGMVKDLLAPYQKKINLKPRTEF